MVVEMEFKELWLHFYLMYWRHKIRNTCVILLFYAAVNQFQFSDLEMLSQGRKRENTSKTSSTSMHIKPSQLYHMYQEGNCPVFLVFQSKFQKAFLFGTIGILRSRCWKWSLAIAIFCKSSKMEHISKVCHNTEYKHPFMV